EAVTASEAFMVTLQPAEPVQAPWHPPKLDGDFAAAVRFTTVPSGYEAVHAPLITPAVFTQLIAPEVSATEPVPLSIGVTLKGKVATVVTVIWLAGEVSEPRLAVILLVPMPTPVAKP